MNKEEIEKEDNYWKGYIEKQKESIEICKMCKYRKRYKELKQKETILDKVTEKLKDLKEIALEDKEQKKIIELPNGIRYEDKVISLDTFIFTIENLLEIIKGEKEK